MNAGSIQRRCRLCHCAIALTLASSTEPGKSSGLTFHYSPYAVGAYAEGPYTASVPWTAFRSYLSQQGAAVFGGERPESDNIP